MIHFDGDGLVYLAGFSADSHGGPLAHSIHSLKLIISKALRVTNEDDYRIFLTSQIAEVNFRTQISDIYKKNRSLKCRKCGSKSISKESYVKTFDKLSGNKKTKVSKRLHNCLSCQEPVASNKPVFYKELREYLTKKLGAEICEWGEADDWMGVDRPDWIATHDKDMYQIGDMAFYNLSSANILVANDELGFIYLDDKRKLHGCGFKWFCCQMIKGDKVDNIEKPHAGDGDVWIHKIFNPLDDLRSSWNMVKFYYTMTGNADILLKQAQLLWVSRKPKQMFTEEVVEEIIEINDAIEEEQADEN
jgi:hypothetical protein